jgi:hypothetical protein
MSIEAELFRAMADRIEAINETEFSGAILIVPPTVQGIDATPIEVLTVEGTPNPDHFWGMTKVRVDTAVANHQEEMARRAKPMGFR